MGDGGRIPLHDGDVLDGHPELVGDHLGQRRFQALAEGGHAELCRDAAGGVEADVSRFGARVEGHAGRCGQPGADAGQLRVDGHADADQAAVPAGLLLLPSERVVADGVAGANHALREPGAVPDKA